MTNNQASLPLISVALCTYNGSKHLREQLDSIVNQNYPHLEIIVVDDCSTDDTFRILKEYAANDSRIKCFANDRNLGFNKNFEKALRLTSGDYIAISDQDDIWDLNKLQLLYDAIGNHWLVFSNSVFIDEKGKPTGEFLLNDFNINHRNFATIARENFITGHAILTSRSLLQYILPLPEQGFYDWWIGFIALYHHQLTYLDRVLTQYRKHENSVVQQMHLDKDDQGIKKMLAEAKITQINALVDYNWLTKDDRQLLIKVQKLIQDTANHNPSLASIKLIYQHYPLLFPSFKMRKGLSRLNFAMRYLRGQI